MVCLLGVAFELRPIEIHGPQRTRRISLCFVAEVWRLRVATFAAGRDRLRAHAVAEFDHRDEAVAGRPVPLLRAGIRARRERRERTPARPGEAHGNARLRVVEVLHDVAVVALIPVDGAPRRAPRTELRRET